MWKNKVLIEPNIRQRIANSTLLSEYEKNNFLRFISYLTKEEKDELLLMV